MSWGRENAIPNDEVPMNTLCNCCFIGIVLSLLSMGFLIKMHFANYL
jgi:hypothetical protein